MSRIPDDEIERVKRETDLVALIQSRGVVLKKNGVNWTGLCPFHDDKKTPNLVATPSKGLWRCMASQCGKAGNAIQFVQAIDGVSFRHAFELLSGGKALETPSRNGKPVKKSEARRLPCPVGSEDTDEAVLERVAEFYTERLATPEGSAARSYLEKRGLGDEGLLGRFGLGLSDRSLGLRVPHSRTVEGAALRDRLKQLGIYRRNGREHLNGCVVVPVRDPSSGEIRQLYGRRIDPKAPKESRHLQLARPLEGLFNPEALESREIILAESILDAMTFVANGMEAATCTYGTANFGGVLEAIQAAKVESVRLAFDADAAGDVAAAKVAERLQSLGIECHRVALPLGSDPNSYAVDQGGDALRRAVRSAQWLGAGASQKAGKVSDKSLKAEEPESAKVASRAPSSLAAEAAKEEKSSPPKAAAPERVGEWWEIAFGPRRYRVGGLERNTSLDSLKVTLRLQLDDGSLHADQLDLWKAADRRRFIDAAAEECRLEVDLLKRDLGRILLAFETLQEERLAGPEEAASEVELSKEQRDEALALLRSPDLLERIAEAFAEAGIVGEETNRLAAYLAATSRLLDKPLAVMIQSSSAAGKTTLMEAVLALFPEEDRVKYSAMTGQSLYYMAEQSLAHKILAVVEEEGAEKASYALKLLQSERELTIASTGKNPTTGRMETQEYHVEGPAAIALTTTSIDVDEELMNRCLLLSVDESREQTEAIQKAQRTARTLAGLQARKKRETVVKLMQNAQRLLEPVAVVNDFAEHLTFTAERTRTRRDHEKYLALIEVVTLLHQHQRDLEEDASGGRYIRATLEDVAAANELAPEILGRSLDELPPQTRRLLDEIRALVAKRMDAKDCGQRDALFTRRELRERIGWSEYQVRAHIDRLERMEYVSRRLGRQGIGCVYELVVEAGTEPTATAWQVGLIDIEKLRKAG